MAKYIPLEEDIAKAFTGSNMSFDISSSAISSVTSSLFVIMVSACLVAGMVMFAYAGVLYVKAGSANQVEDAKKILKRAAFGIIGVLGMYLLLDQINPDMLRGEIGLKPITGSTESQPNTQTGVQTGTPTNATPVNTSINPDEAEARKKLVGVGVNNPAPTTQIAGLPNETIDMVNDLKTYCKCSVVITGGTEPGHKTHGKGLNVVDLRCSSGGTGCGMDDLSNYIRKNGASRSPRSFCYEDFYLNGFLFCNEKNSAVHWHVNKANF